MSYEKAQRQEENVIFVIPVARGFRTSRDLCETGRNYGATMQEEEEHSPS